MQTTNEMNETTEEKILDQAKKKKTNKKVSKSASRLLKKKRSNDYEVGKTDSGSEPTEITVKEYFKEELKNIESIASVIMEDDAHSYVTEIMNQYTRVKGRKKNFKDFVVEHDCWTFRNIFEGIAGNDFTDNLLEKMRIKLSHTFSRNEQYQILVDIIALETFTKKFNQ